MDDLKPVLDRLESCIHGGRYEPIETDACEVKPAPPSGKDWDAIHESVCAFLNKQGGMVILGIKEEKPPHRRFVFSGYDGRDVENLKKIKTHFTNREGSVLDLSEHINLTSQIFRDGHVAIVRVSPLSDDKRFAHFKGTAYEREMNGDREICATDIAVQEDRKEELRHARELKSIEEPRYMTST